MNYRGKKDIRVFNECPFQVNLIGQRREYIFPPCLDGEPAMNFVDFDEIEYAHSRGSSFNIGLLVFAEEDKEGMYEALGIKNWQKTVWRNADIEDIIMNPSAEKMQRVIDIKDIITLERVRGMMVRFMNEKRDVSQNVINIINARYQEINAGNKTSKIVVRAAEIEPRVQPSEVDELKRQLAEMKELMASMAKAAATQQKATEHEKAENKETDEIILPVKKAGRKPATKKQ